MHTGRTLIPDCRRGIVLPTDDVQSHNVDYAGV
jgi:hypothetical protein